METYIETLEKQCQTLEFIRLELEKNKTIETIKHEHPRIETFLNDHPKTKQKLSESNPYGVVAKLIEYNNTFINIYLQSSGSHKEKKYSADKKIGQSLACTYLYPTLNKKPTLQDFKRANRLLEKKIKEQDE